MSDVATKLRHLEIEVARLRRAIAPEREQVRSTPFEVLEVRAGHSSWLGIDIEAIREVVPMMWCDPLPEAPGWAIGTFRYGEEILPLIDLTARLEGSTVSSEPQRRVIVLEEQYRAALAVDEVRSLVGIDPSLVEISRADLSETPFLIGTISTGIDTQLRLISPRLVASELVVAEGESNG